MANDQADCKVEGLVLAVSGSRVGDPGMVRYPILVPWKVAI